MYILYWILFPIWALRGGYWYHGALSLLSIWDRNILYDSVIFGNVTRLVLWLSSILIRKLYLPSSDTYRSWYHSSGRSETATTSQTCQAWCLRKLRCSTRVSLASICTNEPRSSQISLPLFRQWRRSSTKSRQSLCAITSRPLFVSSTWPVLRHYASETTALDFQYW